MDTQVMLRPELSRLKLPGILETFQMRLEEYPGAASGSAGVRDRTHHPQSAGRGTAHQPERCQYRRPPRTDR